MSEAASLLALVRSYVEAIGDGRAVDFCDRVDWEMQERRLQPTTLPCLRHLKRAADMAPMPEWQVVMPLSKSRGALRWGQTYAARDFGADFIANYGWMELFGTRGHFVNDDVAAGFLVLGPGTLYPDHHHIAEELYIPLTSGTEWRKGEGPFVERKAGEVIHHPSNMNHAMRTRTEPLVALYFWRDGPLDQRSSVEP